MASTKIELKKLSDEEIVSLAQQGGEDAADFILNKYKELVANRSRLYFILGADHADVVQEGMIGLFKAIKTYTKDGGASFKTYATLCVNNQILDAVKAAGRKKHSPLNTSVSLENREQGAEDAIEAVDLVRQIEDMAKKQFSSMEKEVWKLYMRGLSQNDIAQKLGKDPKSIYNTMERIKKKVKNLLV